MPPAFCEQTNSALYIPFIFSQSMLLLEAHL